MRNPVYWMRLVAARRRVGLLMTQGVYEPLSARDRAALDEATAAFPELAREEKAYRELVPLVRLDVDDWRGDLLPLLRARIDEASAPAPRWSHAGPLVAAAVLMALVAGVSALFMLNDGQPGLRQIAAPSPSTMTDALARRVEAACDLVAMGDAERAAYLMEEAISENVQDPGVADALLILADIEYSYLQRYERAYDLYDRLQRFHPEVYRSSLESMQRLEKLDMARQDNYQPLREYNEALIASNPFVAYERMLARYPEGRWAQYAMDAMRRTTAVADGLDVMEALERVRDMCSVEVARERIELELGNLYCDNHDAAEYAREHYLRAAASRHPQLAHQAREALGRLE